MRALRYSFLAAFLSFCLLALVPLLCFASPNCFVTLRAETKKIPHSSGKNIFGSEKNTGNVKNTSRRGKKSLFETQKYFSDARKNLFCPSEKNPCGNGKKPRKRKKYRKQKKYQVEAEKIVETGKILFRSGKIPEPTQNLHLPLEAFSVSDACQVIFNGINSVVVLAFRIMPTICGGSTPWVRRLWYMDKAT